MAIELTRTQIEEALPRIAPGLKSYVWLQEHRDSSDLRYDPVYRKRFNHFYRVRRGTVWQDRFYDLLESEKHQTASFAQVLHALHQATDRYEASFASKLVATINPDMPVIDSVVLRNVNLSLPRYNLTDRTSRLERLHETLVSWFHAFLTTESGCYLVKRFREEYPDATISEVKMLDLVLWQTRPTNVGHTKAALGIGGTIQLMSIDDIEAEALKLDPHTRARLAKKLLESLEALSDEENERLWAEEADRRDGAWDSVPGSGRSAADVLRDARAKLR